MSGAAHLCRITSHHIASYVARLRVVYVASHHITYHRMSRRSASHPAQLVTQDSTPSASHRILSESAKDHSLSYLASHHIPHRITSRIASYVASHHIAHRMTGRIVAHVGAHHMSYRIVCRVVSQLASHHLSHPRTSQIASHLASPDMSRRSTSTTAELCEYHL